MKFWSTENLGLRRLRLTGAAVLLGSVLIMGTHDARAQMLSVGNVAIVEVQGTGDSFSFVALSNIPANASIAWTDEGWLAAGGFSGNGTGEQGFNLITIPAGGITAGTVTTVQIASGLGNGGESVYLFNNQTANGGTPVTAPTTNPGTGLLWGTNWGNSGWAADSTSSSTSALASAVTNYNTALPTGAGWVYTGPGTGTAAQLITNIANPGNWSTTTSNDYTGGTAFTVRAVPEPGTDALAALGLAGVAMLIYRRRKATL